VDDEWKVAHTLRTPDGRPQRYSGAPADPYLTVRLSALEWAPGEFRPIYKYRFRGDPDWTTALELDVFLDERGHNFGLLADPEV